MNRNQSLCRSIRLLGSWLIVSLGSVGAAAVVAQTLPV